MLTDSVVVDVSIKPTADSGESNESNSTTVKAQLNENDKENDNIEIVVDDNSNLKEQNKESSPIHQKLSNNIEFELYKQYEDKILSQAQSHRNAVLAASLQYLKPIERERFFAQFNGFNNNSALLIPPNRILTPPPSSSSSSSQQNISPQSCSSSSSSSSSTNEGPLMERYYAPYQTANIYSNNKSSNEQEKLVAVHTQALLAQYAAQQFYQTHAKNFQNHPAVAPTPPSIIPQKTDKDRQPFNIYNPLNAYFASSSSNTTNTNNNTGNGSQKLGISASTSSLSIDDQRASPHTNSYDDDDAASGINCDDGDNQSLNDTNGEWTYEEQFKQVINNNNNNLFNR
jgi:hypothetical protein